METMKALVFDGRLHLTDMPKPKPAAGEALIHVLLTGICKTDVEITKGYMDFKGIPGHEFIGVVESSPDESLTGKRVVGEINAGCGECAMCRNHLERHCPNRSVLGILGRNGAMAEYMTLPVSNLLPVPHTISDEQAVFVEPVAAALEILEQVHIEPNHRVLVIGDGKLGILICMTLRLTGCDLTLVGKHPEKMALAEQLGASVIHSDDILHDTARYDITVEASGSPSGWGLAVGKTMPRGAIVLKSTYAGDFPYNPAPLVIDEITVIGSRCGQFGAAVRLMSRGLIDPSSLISGTFPFEEAEEAFRRSMERDVFKILLHT